MKTLVVLLTFIGLLANGVPAATTINSPNSFGYGANIGWLDWRGEVNNGAVIGEYVCSGYLYAANVGWISLGGGAPANGIEYQNNSTSDFGVNQDGLGNLRGYAYGANIGWVNFESPGVPKVDLATGEFSGYAWSANCGWISLSNALAYVQTDTVAVGLDSDGDGIADAWERTWFGNLTTANASSDYDHDGMTDHQEYLAGTNPLDPQDNLRITSFRHGSVGDPNYISLFWTSQPSRLYRVEHRAAFDGLSPWQELDLGSENLPGWNNAGFDSTGPQYFYRIRAVRPLTQ
jgi:hypothetical protein